MHETFAKISVEKACIDAILTLRAKDDLRLFCLRPAAKGMLQI